MRVAGLRRLQVEQALAVPRHEGVEIDQLRDALARPVGDAGRHHAAIAVPDQHDIAQVLHLEHADDIGDVGVEIDRRAGEMRALAEAGIGRRPQLMPGGAHQRAHLLPGPGRRPGAMGDDEHGHACTPLWFAAVSQGGSPQRVAFTALTLSRSADRCKMPAPICSPVERRRGRETRLCGLGCHFCAIAAWSYAHDRKGAMAGESLSKCCRSPVRRSGFPPRPPAPCGLPELFLDRRHLPEAQEQHRRHHGAKRRTRDQAQLAQEGRDRVRQALRRQRSGRAHHLPRRGRRRTSCGRGRRDRTCHGGRGRRVVQPERGVIRRSQLQSVSVSVPPPPKSTRLGCAEPPAVRGLGTPFQRIHDLGHVVAAARHGLRAQIMLPVWSEPQGASNNQTKLPSRLPPRRLCARCLDARRIRSAVGRSRSGLMLIGMGTCVAGGLDPRGP